MATSVRMAQTADRDIAKNRNAAAGSLWLSKRDLEIFRLLDPEYRFHYLPSHWIHAFAGGDKLRVAKRLTALAEPPHSYLARRKDWYKHAVYSRTVKADRILGEARERDRAPFAHRLLEDLVQASIELHAVTRPGLDLVRWPALANTGKVPQATIESKQPHKLVLPSGALIPDGKPFAIRRANHWRFILGKEIDRATEPLSSGHDRRSIRQKFENYAICFHERIYATHYGFPNAVVLFVTTSDARMRSMMALCESIIGPCSYLAFAATRDWALEPRFPSPTGDLVGPFQRVGHPPLNLDNFGD